MQKLSSHSNSQKDKISPKRLPGSARSYAGRPGTVSGASLPALIGNQTLQRLLRSASIGKTENDKALPEPQNETAAAKSAGFSVQRKIVTGAEERMNDPILNAAYKENSIGGKGGFFFSPESRLKSWLGKDAVGGWKRDHIVDVLPAIQADLSGWPDREGSVWWGNDNHLCNVFVYDSIKQSGLEPPLLGNKHYPGASLEAFHNLEKEGFYETVPNAADVARNDVVHIPLNMAHMAVACGPVAGNKVPVIEDFNGDLRKHDWSTRNLKFFRVKSLSD
ncbi:MAG: hypothetical protein EHM45_13440 [Desulfobacteraceae bacterium]|nr:MAG: hypothetical protein EHM45_13440 [Desulfobacteraceae bacterium]